MKRAMFGGGLLAAVVAAQVAYAAPPAALDKPAFTATPAELLAVAKAAPSAGGDVAILREETDVSYDDSGRTTSTWRMVFAVTTQAGADEWNTLSTTWLPSRQDKPVLRARSIDPGGKATDLDQKTLADTLDNQSSTAGSSDRRRLEGTLPRLAIGSVVEEQVTTVDREPLVGGGAAYVFGVGNGDIVIGSVRFRATSAPNKKLKVAAPGLAAALKPKVETVAGRQVVTYAFGPFGPRDDRAGGYVPPDARPFPYIIVSPAASWKAVASAYRALVDKRIAEGAVTWPADVPKAATLASVRGLVAWLHRQVKVSEIRLDDVSLVPATPAETLKRGTADSKDAATLLVALLRQAGIRAELALIDTGLGPDLDRDVPAASVFDRALVRAHVGSGDVWIDPAERFHPPGQLAYYDQSRAALVIADDTTAPITTPAPAPGENTVREVRTFELAEAGRAKLTEVSRETGVFDAERRAWIAGSAPDDVRKNLTTYLENEYKATLDTYSTSAVDDFSAPLEVKVAAKSVARAYTDRDQVDVYLFPTDTLKHLPEYLSDAKADEPVRKFDFWLSSPHVYEIENRLVPPAGFALPAPAAERAIALGPMKLVEKQRVEGTALVVTFRLEAGKQRLTPAEVTAVQQAMRDLRREDAVHVVFPQQALALADKGKFRDALAEQNKLIALHPKEAIHHQQLAQLLIRAGAGEAAHRAARRAVELEPNSADALVTLGWALQYDNFGRWLGAGHDHAGARAALEKAHKLDPKHVGAATDLAGVLERNARGVRFEVGSDIRAALPVWRDAHALDGSADITYSLVSALLWVGEAAEAEKLLRAMPTAERRDELLIVSAAIGQGTEAALRTASTLANGKTRSKYIGAAASMLMLMRRYDAMRGLFAELQTSLGPVQTMLSQLRREDKPFKAGKDPKDAVIEMFLLAIDPTRPGNPYWDKPTRADIEVVERKSLPPRSELMTNGLFEDIARSTIHASVEGDRGLWRVEVEVMGTKSHAYVAADRGTPKVIATESELQGAGRHVLRLLAKNDETSATRLLDWIAKDTAGNTKSNPLALKLTKVWGGSLPRERKDIELAAAVLAAETDPAHTIGILQQCKPSTTDGQLMCDWTLADTLLFGGRWSDAVDHAREWESRKDSALALNALAYGLAHLGQFDEADKVLADGLVKQPDNRLLQVVRVDIAIARGQVPEAIRRLIALTQSPSSHPGDFNNLAWLELVEGSDLKTAAEHGQRALQGRDKEPHVLNTVAAIDAELGDLGAAKEHLDGSLAGDRDQVSAANLYVHGRILEQLGFTDDAIAVYRQVKDPKGWSFTPLSDDLAARRLKALGVKK